MFESNTALFVGLDVHQDSIAVATCGPEQGGHRDHGHPRGQDRPDLTEFGQEHLRSEDRETLYDRARFQEVRALLPGGAREDVAGD